MARDTPLAAQSAIPQKQLDNDVAEQQSWEAQLKAKQAALANAELNLGWTKVYSPIDGIAGVSNAQVGDLVGTATKMTTVSQVNPIWAYFNISESRFLEFAPEVTEIITGKAPLSSAPSDIEYIQANDQAYPGQGQDHLREPAGRHRDRHHPDGGAVRESRMRFFVPAASAACASSPAPTKGALLVPQAAVMQVQSMYQVRGGHAGEQSGIPSGEGGRSRRHELDHHRRIATGREGRGRRTAEDCSSSRRSIRKRRGKAFPWLPSPTRHRPPRQGATDHA